MKKVNFSQKAAAVIASLALLTVAVPSHAAGVPVFDVGAIAQAIVQVENQVRQIEQLHTQIKAITDNGNYAGLLDDPSVRTALNRYLPNGYSDVFDAVRRGDIGALDKVVKIAEAEERKAQSAQSGKARAQAAVLRTKAQLKLGMDAMAQDVARVKNIMQQINRTQNPAQKADLTNTLTAQSAMIQANAATMNIMLQQAQQEERVARQQMARENYSKFQQKRQEQRKKKYQNAK
ncbi:type IV secretion system protein [Moraxella catarrhalis]|uniref:type IV secretion system protein n=1 Tax=Moraxella catarrhalis TaxID=480 RepID=UPI00128E135B|nr:type IV secretion system protein [Moraxella catarrhalis]MPW90467.1 hypothetical protein [Moraxella catarrhalis]